MIKYGLDEIQELKFEAFKLHIEKRDKQWIDIMLIPTLSESSTLPTDLIDFSILVICNTQGVIAQIVPQDVGCDCEYQLTFSEKEQVEAYIESDTVQTLIEMTVQNS